MALPSGYTRLDYIEATGTQYINTGFIPNGNSRIVMDCEPTSVNNTFGFFCARTATSATDTTSNTLFLISGNYRKDFYGTSKTTSGAYGAGKRITIDSNKNNVTIGTDYSLSLTASTNTSPMALLLMATAVPGSTAGTLTNIANFAKMKLYSAKVYDNGTLVRDFIPCKNASGAIGLWDNVNSVFYANAGTGTFSTGKKHKVLINDTGYEIKSGRVLIAGTDYDIKKGRALIGGTGYDISFGTPVGELAVGSSVFMNVGGVRTEFIVVHQGNPDSSLYDVSCNGTWVLTKNVYGKHVWDNTDNDYKNSDIHAYLNNTFFNLLDSNIQRKIRQVKIPYVNGNGYTDVISTGANGLSTKIFLLSYYEIGFDSSPSSLQWVDGAKLDYFLSGTGASADNRRIAYYNGEGHDWAIRSPDCYSSTNVWCVRPYGDYNTPSVTVEYGIRPSWVLPSDDAKFDDNFNIF